MNDIFYWLEGLDDLSYNKVKDYITNLQQKVEQYENPDDMTLFYMWLDVKAKDKIKELQQENERLKKHCTDLILCQVELLNILQNGDDSQ